MLRLDRLRLRVLHTSASCAVSAVAELLVWLTCPSNRLYKKGLVVYLYLFTMLVPISVTEQQDFQMEKMSINYISIVTAYYI